MSSGREQRRKGHSCRNAVATTLVEGRALTGFLRTAQMLEYLISPLANRKLPSHSVVHIGSDLDGCAWLVLAYL